jgi:16S rRNA (cytosine967-C5)-methyltransferase
MSSAKSGAKVRAEAAKAVDAVVRGGQSLDAALEAAETFINPADRALLHYLSYGTLRRYWQLKAWLDTLLQKPLRARASIVQSLILVGIYQLTDSRVPDHAAVSMTVEAARTLRQPKFKSLINAVLRNFRRQNIEDQPPSDDMTRYSHPEWLIQMLQRDWPDDWRDILEANNDRAPMWLRVNQLRQSTEDYLRQLPEQDTQAHATIEGIESAIRLASPLPVDELPGFSSGDASVQDAAAQLASIWLGAESGEHILDACAAPGGKTGHLLELGGENVTLTAIDSDKSRLARVADNLDRIGMHATLVHADASMISDWWDGKPFNRILLDAPCSATGVIRRHPDIKLLRRENDIASLAALQQTLLDALWTTLAPGGRLMYATCSVLATENEQQIERFLERTPDATENRLLPNNNIRDLMRERACGFQILPGSDGLDGFYYACIEKG